MFKLGQLPEGTDPKDVNKWLLRCLNCGTAVAIWEATNSGGTKKCPECKSILSALIPEETEKKADETPEEEELPKTPPMSTMRALLLQALMGTSLDPMVQVLKKVAFKIDLLTNEMKTRNRIEEAKITYNKALDVARASIKDALKKQERERRDDAKKGQGADHA
jgi:phage FluMu protein Com